MSTNLELVSECSIIWRLGATLSTFVALGTGAFIPAFREAYERGDQAWMRAGFRRMLFLRMSIATTAALILILGGNTLLRVWLHRADFHFPSSVWIAQGVVLASTVWSTAFGDFLTIMDRIWVQVVDGHDQRCHNNQPDAFLGSSTGPARRHHLNRLYYCMLLDMGHTVAVKTIHLAASASTRQEARWRIRLSSGGGGMLQWHGELIFG